MSGRANFLILPFESELAQDKIPKETKQFSGEVITSGILENALKNTFLLHRIPVFYVRDSFFLKKMVFIPGLQLNIAENRSKNLLKANRVW